MAASEPTASILVVDGDPAVATGLTQELQHHYGRDYHLLEALSAQSGLGILEHLAATGQPVALVIAGRGLPDMPGSQFLTRVRGSHPQAKRAMLVHFREVGGSEVLHRAMTLGQADAWLTRPWAPHDQSLYAQVGDLLDEWREDSGRQQFVVVHMVGEWEELRSQMIRDRLDRHAIPYHFTPADSAEGRELLRQAGCGTDRLPVVVLFDGPVLVQPTTFEVAAALGHPLEPTERPYDLAVVGAGPAGLAAAVSAASEGLRTVLIEREPSAARRGPAAAFATTWASPAASPVGASRATPVSMHCCSGPSCSTGRRPGCSHAGATGWC